MKPILLGKIDEYLFINYLYLKYKFTHLSLKSLLMIHQNVPDVNLDGNIGSPPEDDVKVADVGKYSCSSVFKKSYPLHWRMKPVTALNNIVAAFQSMAIINRQNMLVFSSPTSTFYISFSIQEIETVDANMDSLPSENPSFTDLTSATSISGDILDYATGSAASLARCAARANVTAAAVAVSAAMHSDFKSGVITSPPRQKPYPKSRRFTMGASTFNMVPPLSLTKVDHLVIDVFGVDAPSFEITKEFCNLVEAKLNSNLLNIIGSFLARSGSLKLTMADIDFILPCSRPTSSSVKRVSRHVVPEGVIQNHSALLVMHIRQNISLFLSNVNREDFTPVLETYHGLQLPHDAPSS